jgi:hypothetical protein
MERDIESASKRTEPKEFEAAVWDLYRYPSISVFGYISSKLLFTFVCLILHACVECIVRRMVISKEEVMENGKGKVNE